MTTEATVLNRFTSAKPDGADTTVYRPSDHNASRKYTTGTDGDILLRDSSKANSGASWLASVATGSLLISQGAGSLPAWSTSASITSLTLSAALTLTQGTITSDAAQLTGTVTWNNAGIVGPAWKLSVTDTTSNAAALLADLQVGAASKWKVDKTGLVTQTGVLRGPDGAFGAPAWSFTSDPDSGVYITSPGTGNPGINIGVNGARRLTVDTTVIDSANLIVIRTNVSGGGLYMGSSDDVKIIRTAAATIQLGADAASPVAQIFGAHHGSGTDKTGASLTLAGGNGTGTGLGGALIFNTTPAAGGSGSSQNTSTERGRFTSPGHFVLTELTTDPGTGDLAANGAMALYNKNNKIVFAFNNAGTITYCTLAMDGAAVLWAQGTGAP